MNTTLKAALAALLVASMSQASQAQILGDENTSITGDVLYVEEDTVAYDQQAGHAGLTINGAVGLALNPTANLPEVGSTHLQVNFFDLFDSGVSSAKIYGVYAATRLGDTPIELSIGAEKLSSSSDVLGIDNTSLAFGGKYVFNGDSDDPEAVRIAVGAGYNGALYSNKNLYVVASKALSTGSRVINAHLGARYDRFSILDRESSKVSFYGGLEVPIDARGHFTAVGEVQTKNAVEDFGGKSPFSLSVRYQNEGGFTASAGIARQGIIGDIDGEGSSGRLFATVGKIF